MAVDGKTHSKMQVSDFFSSDQLLNGLTDQKTGQTSEKYLFFSPKYQSLQWFGERVNTPKVLQEGNQLKLEILHCYGWVRNGIFKGLIPPCYQKKELHILRCHWKLIDFLPWDKCLASWNTSERKLTL